MILPTRQEKKAPVVFYLIQEALHINKNLVAGSQTLNFALFTPSSDGVNGDGSFCVFGFDYIECFFDAS